LTLALDLVSESPALPPSRQFGIDALPRTSKKSLGVPQLNFPPGVEHHQAVSGNPGATLASLVSSIGWTDLSGRMPDREQKQKRDARHNRALT
jgi:hypothetical protein